LIFINNIHGHEEAAGITHKTAAKLEEITEKDVEITLHFN